MASIISNQLRKEIRELYFTNDIYSNRLNEANDLSIKEKEHNENETQKDKSEIINSIQELRANISQLKKRVEKSNINVKWSPESPEYIQAKEEFSSRECYSQSIEQAKNKAEFLDRGLNQYDEYLVKKRADHKSKIHAIVAVIVIIIAICSIVGVAVFLGIASHNSQNIVNTKVAITSQAEAIATQKVNALELLTAKDVYQLSYTQELQLCQYPYWGKIGVTCDPNWSTGLMFTLVNKSAFSIGIYCDWCWNVADIYKGGNLYTYLDNVHLLPNSEITIFGDLSPIHINGDPSNFYVEIWVGPEALMDALDNFGSFYPSTGSFIK